MAVNLSNQGFVPCVDRIQGYPVSKETAERVFCGLGEENWWKQLYDGKYHHLGSRVFDEGLHKKNVEPGFYDSALKAFQFAKSHLKEKVSVDFYQSLHKEACAHFKAQENNTEMKAREAGRFRHMESKGVKCGFKTTEMLDVFDRKKLKGDDRRKKVIVDYSIVRSNYGDKAVEVCADNTTLHDKETWLRDFTIHADEAQELETLIQNKIKAAQETLEKWNQDPVLKNAAPATLLDDNRFYISYREPRFHNFSFDEVIPHLFTTFNRSLDEIDEKIVSTPWNERDTINALAQKKLALIGALYQILEWCHPFPDGQGRTDLIILSKLLSENGFTPAILDEPYMSSFSSEEDWVAYLIEGMQKWQTEAAIQTQPHKST